MVFRRPWYFSRQTYDCVTVGCKRASLDDARINKWTNACFKVVDTECPAEIPLTPGEEAAGSDPSMIEWECTDGRNPGSICAKTCKAPYKKLGVFVQAKSECICADTCKWIRLVLVLILDKKSNGLR